MTAAAEFPNFDININYFISTILQFHPLFEHQAFAPAINLVSVGVGDEAWRDDSSINNNYIIDDKALFDPCPRQGLQ